MPLFHNDALLKIYKEKDIPRLLPSLQQNTKIYETLFAYTIATIIDIFMNEIVHENTYYRNIYITILEESILHKKKRIIENLT